MEIFFSGVKDYRLKIRASQCLAKIAQAPQKSFPQIFSDPADLEGFYRFVNNERVEVEALVDGLASETISHLPNSDDDLLIIHDTTRFEPTSGGEDEYGPLNTLSRGFHAHVSIVAAKTHKPRVFGVADVFFWARSDKKEGVRVSEGLRWVQQTRSVEEKLRGKNLIHVMDREGDAYEIFSNLKADQSRFVIRLAHNRLIDSVDGNRLFDVFLDAPVFAQRSVQLAQRKKTSLPRQDKIHPPRDTRTAALAISAKTVRIKASQNSKRRASLRPDSLELNVVRVIEQDVPAGEKPVEWYLITSEPISTREEVLCVVDIYRRRWLIEEFFKALKTGCQIQKRLISTLEPWYRMICLFLPVAVTILNLRNLEECAIDDVKILSENHVAILRALAKKKNLELKTVADLKMAIARIGGHIKSSGPPGWQVLARGFEDLQQMEIGWALQRDM